MKSEYAISQQEEKKWLVSKWEGGGEPSQAYEVVESERGSLTCSCPSGMYRGWCKHQAMIRKYQKERK